MREPSRRSRRRLEQLAEATAQPSINARENLAAALRREIISWGMTQGLAGQRIGMDRASVNRLLRGELTRFSLDTLVDLSAAAGLSVELAISPPGAATRAEWAGPHLER